MFDNCIVVVPWVTCPSKSRLGEDLLSRTCQFIVQSKMSKSSPEAALLEDGFYEVTPWQSFRRWRLITIIAGVVILGLTIGLIIAGVQLHSLTAEIKPKNLIFFIGGNYTIIQFERATKKILRISDLDRFG